ncbi:MAG: pyrroloquinoline quinone biosynthesis protein PqqB [Variibacter sp.]
MRRLTAIVLGAAAGGGFPQWNCRCPVCRLAWDSDPRVVSRTQASLAVSGDGERWTLINATPDLRGQIRATPALRPRTLRDSPIASVVLTGAEIDQIAGLLDLRERQPFALYATEQVHATLRDNPIFNALAPDFVTRRDIVLGESIALAGGLEAELFTVPGKVPLYLEDKTDILTGDEEENCGLEVRAGAQRLVYIPGAAAVTPEMETRMARADVLLFDGTLFTDDEMIRAGVGPKTGRRMGHMPIGGDEGSLRLLSRLSARRIYTHINNTNPILVAGSPERRTVESAGCEVAEDGLRIAL